MSRYIFSKFKNTYNGRKYLTSLLLPPIPEKDDDIYIIGTEMMYLDSLADKYYGDVGLWWIIALVNNLGTGRLSVPVGKQLRIPANPQDVMNVIDSVN